jgi:hypothetical protein
VNDRSHWARLPAFVTGLVNQELLPRNEYLAAKNRILRALLPSCLRLSDAERCTLAEIAKQLGRKALKDIVRVGKRILFSGGIVDWSPRNSTDPGIVRIRGVRRFGGGGGAGGPVCAREPRLGI